MGYKKWLKLHPVKQPW